MPPGVTAATCERVVCTTAVRVFVLVSDMTPSCVLYVHDVMFRHQHRQLSTAVEDNGMVKVGNFACARDLPPLGKYRKKDGADLILFKWAAPEVLRGTAFSTASDVW